MDINIHTIITTVCTSIEDIKQVMNKNKDLQMLKTYIIREWPHTKDEVEPGTERSGLIRHEQAMIDGSAVKGKCIIIPDILQ